ncbi:MAG: M60 family metallopeptidase [Odoribacteraceae bacterium]|jgi:hypothetical protein|nr:M60 family metallopeptidase [Odoribacteraceae bacterium]
MKTYMYLWMMLLAMTHASCKEEVIAEAPLLPDLVGEESNSNVDLMENPHWMWVQSFPGLVANAEPRLQGETRALHGMDWHDARISTQPKEPWYSTGLYAPPAEVITITVPEGITTANARIGSTHCKLDPNGKLARYHSIFTTHALAPGENRIYNYFGGLIYIYFTSGTFPEGATTTVTISGGVKSPDFVLGETDAAAWKAEVANSSVPFAEMRSPRIILMLPLEYLRGIEDPTAVMTFLNTMFIEDYDTYLGMSADETDPRDRSPKCPFRFTIDKQLCAGSGHSGYPMMGSWDWGSRLTDLARLEGGEWGVMHEIGHNFQMGSTWNFSALVEVSCNFHIMRYLHRTNRWREDKKSAFEQGVAFASLEGVSKSFEKLDLSVAITPFMQLVQTYDWGLFRYLARKARHYAGTSGSDQDKKDFFALAATEYAGEDLTPFFDAWGITLSTSTRTNLALFNPIAAERADFWKRPFDWDVFPTVISRTEDERVPVIKKVSADLPRAGWTIHSVIGPPTGGDAAQTADRLIDNDESNARFWASPGSGKRPIYDPQIWVIIDMNQVNTITEITVNLRANNLYPWLHPRIFKMEVSDDADGDAWTDAGTFEIPAPAAGIGKNFTASETARSYLLDAPVTGRYIKLTFIEGQWRNAAHAQETGGMGLRKFRAKGYEN